MERIKKDLREWFANYHSHSNRVQPLDTRGHVKGWTWHRDPKDRSVSYVPSASYRGIWVFTAIFTLPMLFVLYLSWVVFLLFFAFLAAVAGIFFVIIRQDVQKRKLVFRITNEPQAIEFFTANKGVSLEKPLALPERAVLLLDHYIHRVKMEDGPEPEADLAKILFGIELGHSVYRIMLVSLDALPGGKDGIEASRLKCAEMWGEGLGTFVESTPDLHNGAQLLLECRTHEFALEFAGHLAWAAHTDVVDSTIESVSDSSASNGNA